MNNRKYLPTLSELVDRLSIAQLKEVFIPNIGENTWTKDTITKWTFSYLYYEPPCKNNKPLQTIWDQKFSDDELNIRYMCIRQIRDNINSLKYFNKQILFFQHIRNMFQRSIIFNSNDPKSINFVNAAKFYYNRFQDIFKDIFCKKETVLQKRNLTQRVTSKSSTELICK